MLSSSKIFSSAFFVILSIKINAFSSVGLPWVLFPFVLGGFLLTIVLNIYRANYIILFYLIALANFLSIQQTNFISLGLF
jgi:hypothetical protein